MPRVVCKQFIREVLLGELVRDKGKQIKAGEEGKQGSSLRSRSSLTQLDPKGALEHKLHSELIPP